MIKKMVIMLSCFCILISFTACSGKKNLTKVSTINQKKENTGRENTGHGRTLIAYFTWADNTEIENEKAALDSALAHYDSVGDSASSDVDATTSASLLAPGNTARIAEWIQKEVGGDLFSIQVKEAYPDNYEECLDRAADEKAENSRPALSAKVKNIEQYDTVFIGYPNWWYTCPMAVFSFIEENDLSGKHIVLFCTHGTGGVAGSAEDMTEALPDDCSVEDHILGVYRADILDAESDVKAWLKEIR